MPETSNCQTSTASRQLPTARQDILQNTVGGGKPKMKYHFANNGWSSSIRGPAPPEVDEADRNKLVDDLQVWMWENLGRSFHPLPHFFQGMGFDSHRSTNDVRHDRRVRLSSSLFHSFFFYPACLRTRRRSTTRRSSSLLRRWDSPTVTGL